MTAIIAHRADDAKEGDSPQAAASGPSISTQLTQSSKSRNIPCYRLLDTGKQEIKTPNVSHLLESFGGGEKWAVIVARELDIQMNRRRLADLQQCLVSLSAAESSSPHPASF